MAGRVRVLLLLFMDQYAFEQYLDSKARIGASPPQGEYVKNAFGQDELVVLPEIYWRYMDWLVMVQGADLDPWVKQCDLHREDKTLSENLMEWLYWDMMERQKNDEALPSWLVFL